jgi:peptidoglycan/xylan/chitin deacetylase (PgdA/CDA1 family)
LRDIVASNIECGAHSHRHLQLDMLPLPLVRDEVVRSKQILEHHLGQSINSFAYPFGYHTAQVRQAVRKAGYTSACAVGHALSSQADDPFTLTRLMIGADLNIQAFAALLADRNLSIMRDVSKLYLRTRTSIWQAVRRCTVSGKQYIRKDNTLK